MAKLTVKDIPNSLMCVVRWENDSGVNQTYYLPKPLVDLMKANLTLQDLQNYKARNDPVMSFTV